MESLVAATPLSLPSSASSHPTSVLSGTSERMARLSRRRRSSSTSASHAHQEENASIYLQGAEEVARAKGRDMERIKGRLREALLEAAAHEDNARSRAQEIEALHATLQLIRSEHADVQQTNEMLLKEGSNARSLRRHLQDEVTSNRRERLEHAELSERGTLCLDEADARAWLLHHHLAVGAFASAARLHIEGGALRKQVKEMQIRMEGLAYKTVTSPQQENSQSNESLKEELSAMRREKNEAVGALRAERAAHSSLLERFHSAEATRDTALRQLAEVPDLERHIEQVTRSRLGETAWLQDRSVLEGSLRQKTQELAAMAKKRDKAKRREAEAVQEAVRLRRVLAEHLGAAGKVAGTALLQDVLPPSRADTPLSWSSAEALNAVAVSGGPSKDAEVAFLRSRVRELTHQGRYAAGFATPPPGMASAP